MLFMANTCPSARTLTSFPIWDLSYITAKRTISGQQSDHDTCLSESPALIYNARGPCKHRQRKGRPAYACASCLGLDRIHPDERAES